MSRSSSESRSDQWPPVSILMPMLNEAGIIRESVGAMLEQDYEGELEVLCVDGMSTDGTRELIAELAARDPRVRLVDNPQRIIPAAVNVGVRAARHALVLRMDAHSIARPDYVRKSVELMQQTGGDFVGGRWEIVGTGYVGEAIAAAMQSRFGVGTASWRTAGQPRQVDTVPYGMWRRDTFLELGGFNEALLANEDYEFCIRLREAGGEVWYSPEIVSRYHCRPTLRALWRQYRNYGFWKARVSKLHPRSLKVRHLVAPAFVAGLVGGLPLLALPGPGGFVYLGAVATYLAGDLAASVRQAAAHGWRYLPVLPLIFPTFHLAWGVGFWTGLTKPKPASVEGQRDGEAANADAAAPADVTGP